MDILPLLRRLPATERLWPLRCLLCDEPADNNSAPLCSACETELPWLGDHCQCCALPLPLAGRICGQCLQRRPAFDSVQAPWCYGFPVDSLINRFKHQQQWPYGRLLGQLLARHLLHAFAEGLPPPELLLAVPLAPHRERQRGFNQAALLADWLSKPLGLAVQSRWLSRISDGPSQQQSNLRQRQRNLRRAFRLTPDAQPQGRHLALVDDVLTSGATAQQLARLLKRAGAKRVDVYCLARTPAPGEPN